MKKLFGTKKQGIQMVKVNNDVELKAKVTIKEIETLASGENLYPACRVEQFLNINGVDLEIDLEQLKYLCRTLCETYGKLFTPKKGGYVCKSGKQRLFEIYLVSDGRVHMYLNHGEVKDYIKKTCRCFETTNDRWSWGSRVEINELDFYPLANYLLANQVKF